MATGRACGLDVEGLSSALLGGLADSAMLREYIRGSKTGETPHMTHLVNSLADLLHGRPTEAGRGRYALLLKDLGIVADLARSTTTATPVIALVEQLVRMIHGSSESRHR